MCASRFTPFDFCRSHIVFASTALKFEDAPDYQRIRDILSDGAAPNLNNVTFDWEVRTLSHSPRANVRTDCATFIQVEAGKQHQLQRPSHGAWFARTEPAGPAPMPAHSQPGWPPAHAAPDLTPGDGPGSAKRARVEHMSTPAFSEALTLRSHINGSGCVTFRCTSVATSALTPAAGFLPRHAMR